MALTRSFVLVASEQDAPVFLACAPGVAVVKPSARAPHLRRSGLLHRVDALVTLLEVRLVRPLLGEAARRAASSDRVGSIGRISTGFVKLCSPVVKRAPGQAQAGTNTEHRYLIPRTDPAQ
jgi:hypothetical protein